jgi:hypothetical protein
VRFFNGRQQFVGKDSGAAVLRKNIPHVDQLRLGQWPVGNPIRQAQVAILARLRVVKRFQ